MGKNTITALLTDLRALILKSRPAYRDFLGEVTETKTTKILEDVVLTSGAVMPPAAGSTFSGFVIGESYRVILNGKETSAVAFSLGSQAVLSDARDFQNPPDDFWAVYSDTDVPEKVMAGALGSFVGATISVYYDETVTEQRWSVKKLAYELLPDRLLSALSAAASMARNALTAASFAQSTANAAQSTANAAQSTANAAQSTANAAKILPVQYNYFAGLASKHNEFLGWYSIFPELQYSSNGGYFFKSFWETEPLTAENIPSRFICKLNTNVDGFSAEGFTMILDAARNGMNNSWTVGGVAIVNDGRIYRVTSNYIPISSAQGIQLVFSPPTTLFVKSSTANSDKKFKITVDDTGTLSATEVTDTTT